MKTAKEWAVHFPQGVCGDAMKRAAKMILEIQRDAARSAIGWAADLADDRNGEEDGTGKCIRAIDVDRLIGGVDG